MSEEYIECIYWGIFFADEEMPQGTLFREIESKHVTFAFREPFPARLLGLEEEVTIYGYGNDLHNEALFVELSPDAADIYDKEAPPHITLSVSEDGKPVDSARLLFERTERWSTTGFFGYFGEDGRVHLS